MKTNELLRAIEDIKVEYKGLSPHNGGVYEKILETMEIVIKRVKSNRNDKTKECNE